ncbi:hypothetical protein V8D89_003671, partial [Ganoderma adspersum]
MDPLRNIPRLSELSGHLRCLPTTDRGTFATLASVQDIQSWTAAKADEYRQFALALLAIHNLAAPIHRLPTEVLEQILELCWQDWNSLRLPHVCRLWRSILLDRPAFWADAVADCELPGKREVVRNELPLINALLSRSARRSRTIKPSFYTFPPSVAEVMTPHVSSVVSLQVAVGRGDLLDRLWPALVSGMPNLEALVIQLTVTEEDLSGYNEYEDGDLTNYHCKAWNRLSMLSRKALPKLVRLTCPQNMIGLFGDISLRHVRVEWIDRSPQSSLSIPKTDLDKLGGLHLKPFRVCLETLEIMPTSFGQWRSQAPSSHQELPFLHYLHIKDFCGQTSRLLSWLLLPKTTFIRITDLGQSGFKESTKLRSIVSTIDCVWLQQLQSRYPNSGTMTYHIRCFAADTEYLRIES